MAIHNVLGRVGEEAACRYLMHRGYQLNSRNWRSGHLEIDIVAEWHGEIVFVEVKTRSHEEWTAAADAVDLDKKEHLLAAAKAYMAYFQLDLPYRFDIVTVVGEAPEFEVHHIVNAFTRPGVVGERTCRKYRMP